MKTVITLAFGLGMLTLSTGCCHHHQPFGSGGPCGPACGPGSNLGGATTFPQGAFYSSPATATTQATPMPVTTIGANTTTPYYDTAYQQPVSYAPVTYAPAGFSQTAAAPPMQALPTY